MRFELLGRESYFDRYEILKKTPERIAREPYTSKSAITNQPAGASIRAIDCVMPLVFLKPQTESRTYSILAHLNTADYEAGDKISWIHDVERWKNETHYVVDPQGNDPVEATTHAFVIGGDRSYRSYRMACDMIDKLRRIGIFDISYILGKKYAGDCPSNILYDTKADRVVLHSENGKKGLYDNDSSIEDLESLEMNYEKIHFAANITIYAQGSSYRWDAANRLLEDFRKNNKDTYVDGLTL